MSCSATLFSTEAKQETTLHSILEDIKKLIPKELHVELEEPKKCAPVPFKYKSFEQLRADHKTYSINAARALYQAIKIIIEKKIFNKSLSALLLDHKSDIDLIQQHLWSLDGLSYLAWKPHSDVSSHPFELIRLNESEWLIVDSVVRQKVTYALPQSGGKLFNVGKDSMKIVSNQTKKSQKIEFDHSWMPHIVNDETLNLANISIKFSDYIMNSKDKDIAKWIKEYSLFKQMAKAIKHVLPPRIVYYNEHILKQEKTNEEKATCGS